MGLFGTRGCAGLQGPFGRPLRRCRAGTGTPLIKGAGAQRAGAWLALVPSILVPLTPSQQKVKLSVSRPSVGRHVGRSAPVSHRGRGVVFIADTMHARMRRAHAATHRVEVPSTSSNNTALTARAVLDLMRRYRSLLFHGASCTCVYSHAFREDRWLGNPVYTPVRFAW